MEYACILSMLVSDEVQFSNTDIKALIHVSKSEYVTQDAMTECVSIYTEMILVR